MSIADRWVKIRASVPAHVTIVGAAKKQSAETVREAVRAGLTVVANNYAQEGAALREALRELNVAWHFIGSIQSRKAKLLTSYQCVQSLDRLDVARELSKRLPDGARLDVLVEVNIGDESSKSGIAPADLAAFLEGLAPLSNLHVRGLMGMPPPLEPVELRRPFFRTLRSLFERHPDFDCLSMGTSADYPVAVQEGSTMIRLGTTLFGERPAL